MHTRTPEPMPSEVASTHGLIDPATLWRRRWWLAATVIVAVLLGFLYLAVAAPMRHVGARLLVVEQGLLVEQDRPAPEDKNFLATQAEIIRSPAVIERVVATLPQPPLAAPDYDPLAATLENLTVDPLAGTNVLSVRFRDRSPERAITVLEAVIGSYRDYVDTSDRSAHQDTLRLLREREQQARGEIAALQERVQQLRKEGAVLGQGREAGQVERSLLT
ncbi:MAG: hypothetical protein KY475_23210, partial [Planctomycetes bacterium]|nr:hypothetical protein [Planctomycetota bacterium]